MNDQFIRNSSFGVIHFIKITDLFKTLDHVKIEFAFKIHKKNNISMVKKKCQSNIAGIV